MEEKRNFANIRCNTGVSEQNMQHFMSHSPWSAQAVIRQVQAEIAATPGLGLGGVLILDESAEKKAGNKSAGSGRQYNGRLGKEAMSQVGTFFGLCQRIGVDIGGRGIISVRTLVCARDGGVVRKTRDT